MVKAHFKDDLEVLQKTEKGAFFLRACGGDHKDLKPYSGTHISHAILNGFERTARTTLLQTLTGESFLSEHRMSAFHRGNGCPLCGNSSSNLRHFMLECTSLDKERDTMKTLFDTVNPQISAFLDSDKVSPLEKTIFLLTSNSQPDFSLKLTALEGIKILIGSATFLENLKSRLYHN